jgi:hypothetical protein
MGTCAHVACLVSHQHEHLCARQEFHVSNWDGIGMRVALRNTGAFK